MLIKKLETEAEIDGKAFVHCRAWKEAYDGLLDASFLAGRTVEFSRQRARKAFADGILTLIAVDGERVVGFADCGRCRDDDLPSAGEVYALYVLKEYCGRGVGTSLMRSALEALRDYRQIAVWVLRKNGRAIRFYEGFGYRFDGREQILQLGTAVAEARMILSR